MKGVIMHSISIVAAMTNDQRVIGNKGEMPWGRMIRDLEYFKKLTMGFPVVVGYNTLLSISEMSKRNTNLLPGRTLCVLTRDQNKLARFTDCIWLPDVMSVINLSQRIRVFIAGGESVYNQFIGLPEVRTIYMTRVIARYHGDTFFPNYSEDDWLTIQRENHAAGDKNKHPLVFETLIRRK